MKANEHLSLSSNNTELTWMATEAFCNYTIIKKEIIVTGVYCTEFSSLCYYTVTPIVPAL